MASDLTPDLALDYLAELSTDIRAAVVLDAAGQAAAGEEQLAEPARALLERAGVAVVEVLTPRGGVFAARGRTHSLAVVTGRFALPALVRYDVRKVLADLDRPAPA